MGTVLGPRPFPFPPPNLVGIEQREENGTGSHDRLLLCLSINGRDEAGLKGMLSVSILWGLCQQTGQARAQ